MFDRLDSIRIRYEELEAEMNNPYVVEDQAKFRKLMKEHADLTPIVEAYREYRSAKQDIEDIMYNNAVNLIEGARRDIYGEAK